MLRRRITERIVEGRSQKVEIECDHVRMVVGSLSASTLGPYSLRHVDGPGTVAP
jgi:hypothetical protein